MATTLKTITNQQIEALCAEAAFAGDEETVIICTRARDGSRTNRKKVIAIINAAEAVDDLIRSRDLVSADRLNSARNEWSQHTAAVRAELTQLKKSCEAVVTAYGDDEGLADAIANMSDLLQ